MSDQAWDQSPGKVGWTATSVRATLVLWGVSLGEDAEYQEVALRLSVLLRAVAALMPAAAADPRILLPDVPGLTERR